MRKASFGRFALAAFVLAGVGCGDREPQARGAPAPRQVPGAVEIPFDPGADHPAKE